MSYELAGYKYRPISGGQSNGDFEIIIDGGEVYFRGKYFSAQEPINRFLYSKGVAIRTGLVDFGRIRQYSGRNGGMLLLESIFYQGDAGPKSRNEAKRFLTVAKSPSTIHAEDEGFLVVKNGKLCHARTGDLIPPDEWVPLYRPGSVLDGTQVLGPIDLEVTEHVIF